MNYSIPNETVGQILELKKTMDKINLNELSFSYIQNPYGDIEIHILKFKEHCEVRVVNERKTGGIYYRFLDSYKLVDDEIIYQDTETDML